MKSIDILNDNGYILIDYMFPYYEAFGDLYKLFVYFKQNFWQDWQLNLLWDLSYGVGVFHRGENQECVIYGDEEYIKYVEFEQNFRTCVNPIDNKLFLNSLGPNTSNYKYSVLTCIFDDYEIIREIPNPREDVEYVLVTDDPNLTSSTWNIKLIDAFFDDMSGYAKAFYVKYHPFEFVGTDTFIWIDGSIQIQKDFTNTIMVPFIDSEYELLEMINTISAYGLFELDRWVNNEFHGFNQEQYNLIKKLYKDEPWINESQVQTTIYCGKNTRLVNQVNARTWDLIRRCSGTDLDVTILYMPQRGMVVEKYMGGTYKVYYMDCSELFGDYFDYKYHRTNVSQIKSWVEIGNDISKREGVWGNYRCVYPKKYSNNSL